MEQELVSWLSSDNGLVIHSTIFFLLILGGLGFPIPEDIPLLLAGVAAAKGIVGLQLVFITCYLGVVLADQIVYFIGFFFGQRLLNAGTKSRFFPAITEKRVKEVREGLRKRRLFYIFVGRHLFPVRSVTFVTAGALRIPYWEFFVTDAVAALVSVAIVLGIGYYLGEHLTPEVVQNIVEQAHFYITAAAIILLCSYLFHRSYKHRKLQAKKNQLPEAEVSSSDSGDDDEPNGAPLQRNSQ